MKTSFSRVRKSVTVVALSTMLLGGVGLVAANAEVVTGMGVTATTSPGAAGQGSLTLVTDPGFPVPVTVTVFVVGTGGTLTGGAFEQPVELNGTAVSVAYNCVGSSVDLGIRFPGKTGPTLSVPAAPCGAVAEEPPAASWNQTATIIPGRAGSGNATVEFNNMGSNRDAVFYVTFGDGQPTSATTVAAGQTSSIPVHPGPGVVVRVFGTQDGTAQPKLLAELPLPTAPTPPAPSWNQSASIIFGPDGSGRATVLYNNEKSNADGGFYVTVGDGEPTSAQLVLAGQTFSVEIKGMAGEVIRVFGTKDGKGEATELIALPLPELVTVTPAPPKEDVPAPKPLAPAPPDPNAKPAPVNQVPAAPVLNQPSEAANSVPLANVGASVPAQSGEQRFSFDTAVPSKGISPLTVLGFVFVAVAAAYVIGSVVVRRRRA